MKGPTHRKTGGRACKVCIHPGRDTIDAMLGAEYEADEIISWATEKHPETPALYAWNLSRHGQLHPLHTPEGVEMPVRAGSALVPAGGAQAVSVKAFVPPPEERVSLADATAIVLNLALQNAIRNPESVTLKDAAAFAELGRKLGLKGNDADEFKKAWDALASEKDASSKRGKRTTKVTVTKETVEEPEGSAEPSPEIIDVTPEAPDTWAMPNFEEKR